ncbi:phosphatidylglycerophosphatase A [Blochmannia endosymbiont of Polyrhachis (Hedomyrma) turneri]|uniref:phosphatidylglycerophosphatase A family protein n=1 Tax=Blochmannia endosymbiont of Polyrhachis (Hedomyrma) turneri TaxID=1505596 RepID=UPI00061A5590|nr:phosphatidylglycerophosphatase A [Blochmannia endosymbiont of Polyrhachis (Hedomyrma) turneri]AKC59807.1 Phosphatidylglycerophosphatase A [Blochmannia endosymbiont of Polyrhachis (Hedomyrma) turneri]
MVCHFGYSYLLATFFGVGLISWISAPGTCVSFLSILLWYFLSVLFSPSKIFFIILLVLIIGIGCYVCHVTNENLVVHDHQCIVLDEFIGMWFVLILSPNISIENWLLVFFGFFCFRVFDIYKPWPIFLIDENIKNGLGIVFDDIAAGIFTIFVLFLFDCCL